MMEKTLPSASGARAIVSTTLAEQNPTGTGGILIRAFADFQKNAMYIQNRIPRAAL